LLGHSTTCVPYPLLASIVCGLRLGLVGRMTNCGLAR